MINAIFAYDCDGGIGKNGVLPWPHNSSDMKWFSDNTKNGIVIMGRKTWESLGSVRLKNRINVVLTSDANAINGNPDITISIQDGLTLDFINKLSELYKDKKLWVIGGGEVYKQLIPHCDYLYVTEFSEKYDCDTFINKNMLKPFRVLSTKQGEDCTFSILGRV